MELGTAKAKLGEIIKIQAKMDRVKAIEQAMANPDYWLDYQTAGQEAEELKHLQLVIAQFEAANTPEELEKLTEEAIFTGSHDDSACYLGIHAGSGGTEAQDWAAMLLRMYTRFAERQGFEAELLDSAPGEEVGIKSATLLIRGFRAYGFLKGENGVHRLVRISPFDADKARHTSFALVETVPELTRTEIEIKPDEIKVDVFRSQGAGGQSVNTTDSAVRITHLPTNIVVSCQNERSQVQNRAMAMKILQGKLQLLDDEKQRMAEQNLKGEPVLAAWGNQIRSYVLQPYQMVKDNRSGYETSQVDDVLAGDIVELSLAYLKSQANK